MKDKFPVPFLMPSTCPEEFARHCEKPLFMGLIPCLGDHLETLKGHGGEPHGDQKLIPAVGEEGLEIDQPPRIHDGGDNAHRGDEGEREGLAHGKKGAHGSRFQGPPIIDIDKKDGYSLFYQDEAGAGYLDDPQLGKVVDRVSG